MPLILRRIDRIAGFQRIAGLETGDVQADAVSDLRTRYNALSVWLVPDDRSNVNRVVAALAAGRMSLTKLDYALINLRVLEDLHFRVVRASGESSDNHANDLWHRDVTGLTGMKLVKLAATLQEQAEFVRVQRSDVRFGIEASIREGFIDPNQLNSGIRKALNIE